MDTTNENESTLTTGRSPLEDIVNQGRSIRKNLVRLKEELLNHITDPEEFKSLFPNGLLDKKEREKLFELMKEGKAGVFLLPYLFYPMNEVAYDSLITPLRNKLIEEYSISTITGLMVLDLMLLIYGQIYQLATEFSGEAIVWSRYYPADGLKLMERYERIQYKLCNQLKLMIELLSTCCGRTINIQKAIFELEQENETP